jgi:hypothetical protein
MSIGSIEQLKDAAHYFWLQTWITQAQLEQIIADLDRHKRAQALATRTVKVHI